MGSFMINALITLVPFVAIVNGHMTITEPKPFGQFSRSPLEADGSNFPCQGIAPGAFSADATQLTVGGTFPLTFDGTATHGGGSCQISLSSDIAPTKNSKWQVIQSYEGGCPTKDPGNGGAHTPLTYTVPSSIAPGQYTIAWTWLNKVGNREFYMNCGHVNIAAGARKRYAPQIAQVSKRQSALPDMLVANLAGINTCATAEGLDISYPNPGALFAIGDFPGKKLGAPTGDCGPSGAAAPAAPAGSATTSAGAAAATTSAGSAPGVFASGAASASSAAPTSAAGAATTSAAAAPSSTAAGAAPAASSAGATTPTVSGAQTPGAACTPEGAFACAADGKSFQRCASGVWSAVLPMAAGTECTPGTGANFEIKAVAPVKRRAFVA